MITEQTLVDAYRKAHPQSRITSIVKFTRNGTNTQQRGCVLCGEDGPSWCGRYRKTLRATEWEWNHINQHLDEANACAAIAKALRKMGRQLKGAV